MNFGKLQPGVDWRLKRTVAPTIEPVSLESFRLHCRIDTTEEDEVLSSYLSAAREMLEADTQRGFLPQTWQLTLDGFPDDVIELRRCPVTAVSSITYTDIAGASQTLSTSVYAVDLGNEPARITLKHGQVWPYTLGQANVVTVTFTVGYTVLTVPQQAQQAIRMLAAHWYNNRETIQDKGQSVPYGYDALVGRLMWSGYR